MNKNSKKVLKAANEAYQIIMSMDRKELNEKLKNYKRSKSMNIFKKLFEKEESVQDMVTLNGSRITRKKLQEKIKEAKQQKGMKIREISPNVFRTKLED